MIRTIVLGIALVACKADDPAPAAAPVTTSSSSAPSTMPVIEGAKVLKTHQGPSASTITTVCIDEADAIARVTAALVRDGWTDVHTRGTGDRVGIAASSGGVRFSAVTVRHDERCAGTLVSATIMTLGKLPAPGDKIR